MENRKVEPNPQQMNPPVHLELKSENETEAT